MKLQLKTDGLTGDTLAFVNQLNAKFNEMPEGITKEDLEKAIKDLAPTSDLEAIKTQLAEKHNELLEILKTQGTALTELKNGNTANTKETLAQVVEKEAEGIKKSAKRGYSHEFIVKADTVRASVASSGAAQDLTDIGQLAHRKLTVYDMFRKVPVSRNANGVVRYVDWDAATIARAAAAVAEGGTFPESTAKWATYTLSLEKVGDTIPVSEEFLYDSAMFAAELENFLRTNVAIKVDTDLVDANGTSPNINGLKNQIPAFTAAASGITDANIYDLLVKVREAITSAYGSKYNPNVALMNIADINKMKLKKDANNNYIMPPFADRNGNIIEGMTIIECNAFTANTMAVGDSRYGAIYEEPGFEVVTGYASGDFVSDMLTIKARKRMNLLIRNVDRTGWLEVTSISAALTTLAT